MNMSERERQRQLLQFEFVLFACERKKVILLSFCFSCNLLSFVRQSEYSGIRSEWGLAAFFPVLDLEW